MNKLPNIEHSVASKGDVINFEKDPQQELRRNPRR